MMEKKILLGNSSFRWMMSGEYYVIDKTQWIRRLFEDGHAVSLVTRPRRFGKTFTLDMLRTFFELDCFQTFEAKKTAELFRGTDVLRDKAFCEQHMMQWPTVFLSLKDVYATTMAEALDHLAFSITQTGGFADWLLESPKIFGDRKEKLEELMQADGLPLERKREALVNGLRTLTEALSAHGGRPCLVLIDEYDAPLVRAAANGYGEAMESFLRSFYERGLHESPCVGKAVLTGCVSFAASVLSGIRDLGCHTMDDQATLGGAVGLTRDEVRRALQDFGLSSCEASVEAFYGGRMAGGVPVTSPWDLWNFCRYAVQVGVPQYKAYWLQTSANAAVSDFVEYAARVKPELLDELLAGRTIEADVSYELCWETMWDTTSAESQLALLYASGYLASDGRSESGQRRLRIANEEVRNFMIGLKLAR